MSGGLFVSALARETGRQLSRDEIDRMQHAHTHAYLRYSSQVRPLPGARDLLAYLSQEQVPHAIATSGHREAADVSIKILGVGPSVPISPVSKWLMPSPTRTSSSQQPKRSDLQLSTPLS
jgi:phosphoglycolate phosphatase-like HAD superfamily hydrolase